MISSEIKKEGKINVIIQGEEYKIFAELYILLNNIYNSLGEDSRDKMVKLMENNFYAKDEKELSAILEKLIKEQKRNKKYFF